MRSLIRMLLLATALGACGKGASNAKSSKDDSTAMADMPGMVMPKKGDTGALAGMKMDDTAGGGAKSGATALATELSLTAQQVEHGHVRWEAVKMEMSAATATVPGELTPNEDHTARLGAPARGRVVDVRAQPGDHVTRGQVLVTLQSGDAAMAQSDLAKATAEVTARRAQAQYATTAKARAERLLVLKAIPRQDYDRAVADDEQARASLVQAEAELRRAHSAAEQLGAAASASGEIAMQAPFDGVVLARTAVPGSVVDAGAPLIVVTNPATLWLRVNAPEQFASLFHNGGTLRFTVPAYPTETFIARIDAVGAGLDPDTRTLGVRGVVPSTGKLKAQMLATVTVTGTGQVRAVVLPEDAVPLMQGQPTVFIATPDGKGGARFERRTVEVGARVGGRIAVTRGLKAGDVVATAGALAVKAAFEKGAMPKMEM